MNYIEAWQKSQHNVTKSSQVNKAPLKRHKSQKPHQSVIVTKASPEWYKESASKGAERAEDALRSPGRREGRRRGRFVQWRFRSTRRRSPRWTWSRWGSTHTSSRTAGARCRNWTDLLSSQAAGRGENWFNHSINAHMRRYIVKNGFYVLIYLHTSITSYIVFLDDI